LLCADLDVFITFFSVCRSIVSEENRFGRPADWS